MTTPTEAPAARPSLPRRIMTHWVARLLLSAVVFVLLIVLLVVAGLWLFPWLGPAMLQEIAGTLSALATIALVTRLIERRPLSAVGLGLRGLPGQLGRGFLVGAGFMAACVAVLALLGGYRVTGARLLAGPLLLSLAFYTLVGLFEEIAFRGILFRLLEEGLGSWAALAITAAIFGAAHLGNPDATLWGAAAIMIEAGVLLGAAYMLTRSLWFVAGLHLAWNFFQGPIFGFAISGTGATSQSLLMPMIQGPELLTGGVFGIEASLIAVLLGLALGVWYAARAARAGRTVRPLLWRGGVARVGS